MKKTKVLITGLNGFIGSHLGNHILRNTDWDIVGLDRLGYSGTNHRMLEFTKDNPELLKRVNFIWHDLSSPINRFVHRKIGHVDYVFHLAASTHVDRSIENPRQFVIDNVLGTTHLLEWAKTKKYLKKFLYFSTDEVFGSVSDGDSKEWDCYNSGNPYAASKAGGEEMALAFGNTYGLPVIITHTMNAFGEYQHPEKFIPKVISKVLKDEIVTIHANKEKTKAGSRKYIHCSNIAKALIFLIENAPVQDKYNIVGEKEMDNLELAEFIAKHLGYGLKYEMVDFHSSRPGHDLRYSLDGKKLKDMGFEYPNTFEETLKKTINFYTSNQQWLK